MQIFDLNQITVGKRQRKKIDEGGLLELKTSILARGLLHPPVVWHNKEANTYELIVGERRFTAIQSIGKDGLSFRHGTEEVSPGQIPITIFEFRDEADRFAAELEENTHRVDITWQERCEALATLHDMRKAANPDQTLRDTATELVASGKVGNKVESSAGIKNAATTVKQAIVVARYLNDPQVANARNATEAYNQILRKEEHRINAAIARRSLATVRPEHLLIEVREGDLHTVLPSLSPGTVDLIFADPPYGIDASGGGFRQRTEVHHHYEDTPEEARRIAVAILTEGFRLAKPRANLLLFTDIKLFEWLGRTAKNMGWSPFPRPIIWGKSESEGLAPWGGDGPRITTEFIFYATKGRCGMRTSPTDYIPNARVPRNEREHAAQKPVALLKYLIECCTLPGDFVLDPCCGSGSTLVAAKSCGRIGLGIEKDHAYYELALATLHGKGDSDGASG